MSNDRKTDPSLVQNISIGGHQFEFYLNDAGMWEMYDEFHGGKMHHLMEFFKCRGPTMYTGNFSNDAAARAFNHSEVYFKVEGRCGRLEVEDGMWVLKVRIENKKQPETYRWEKCQRGLKTAFTLPNGCIDEVYDAIDYAVRTGILPDPSKIFDNTCISIEIVGPGINNNPDNLVNHSFAIHALNFVQRSSLPDSLEEIIELFKTRAFEGLIFRDPETGEFFKFRANMCGGLYNNCQPSWTETSVKCKPYTYWHNNRDGIREERQLIKTTVRPLVHGQSGPVYENPFDFENPY
jgi:hypothetical protein